MCVIRAPSLCLCPSFYLAALSWSPTVGICIFALQSWETLCKASSSALLHLRVEAVHHATASQLSATSVLTTETFKGPHLVLKAGGIATLIQIKIPQHFQNRGSHPAYQLETVQGSVSSWSLTCPLSGLCHHHHHQRCHYFWLTDFSRCWVTVWHFLTHNDQLRLSLLAPCHNLEVISLFQLQRHVAFRLYLVKPMLLSAIGT